MSKPQPAILEPVPLGSRYLFFNLVPGADPTRLRRRLEQLGEDKRLVIGLGKDLLHHLGTDLEELPAFPAYSHQGISIPSTPFSLWCWLSSEERGELLHRGRAVEQALCEDMVLSQAVDGFRYKEGRDLTGYEDGTENPEGEAALEAAVTRLPERLAGSSFVAVQQWQHNFNRFEEFAPSERDDIMGRRLSDNEELDNAPPLAHVKRTAQESFTPEAFLLRRSMPWMEGNNAGLMFVAFGHSVAAFDAQLKRMVGLEDGITDGLFRFTQPRTGSYFWCPPRDDAGLDLSALDLHSPDP